MEDEPERETSPAPKPAERVEITTESKRNALATISEETVQQALEEILIVFKADHKSMEAALLKQPFEVRDNYINFLLHGGLQEDIFSKLKPELTGLFRRKLNHPELEVTFEIRNEAVDPSKNLYTSSEKLTFLLKKSPALKELKNRFGLETDF